LVPDSAHGTNPATAAMCGFQPKTVPSDERGNIDLGALKVALAQEKVAGLMLTNPNTLGLFEENILEITESVHRAGGLVYCDGANMNALLGIAKPGELGVDILHLNLHKTFSTPHGGGGPGAGATAVRASLAQFLPIPVVVRDETSGRYSLDYDRPESIGRVRSFYGNFGIMVRAYADIRSLGGQGLREASEAAVLNANYLLASLGQAYELAYPRQPLHEFVLSARRQARAGVRALDIAKRLIDFGFHPPTIYFPLVVPEALMIEPTETESKETLDAFIEALLAIAGEASSDPDLVHNAPYTTPISRLDEARAARQPDLRWQPGP
ncbi:MAG: aminomethyl-transferring glycine dehydrogenase subunit GcvPB, partial [Chloroflexota bacterium]|nr:aminomethyl-transferring glycine dehydrogenase subunit GcvPB [Chloroflexota bacterium]